MAEGQAEAVVHDVVHHPHRDFGNARREFADLDAVELVDIDLRESGDVEDALLLARIKLAQDIDFELAQFAIGDDEEVAAAAGGIEEGEAGQLFVQGLKRLRLAATERFRAGELRVKVVQKERLDELQDVLFGGVVRARGAAFLLVHDGLEERTENGRRDRLPFELAGLYQGEAHGSVESGGAQALGEEIAIDVGELVQVFIERLVTLVFRRVQHLEEFVEAGAKIAAVGLRPALDEIEQDVLGLEDAGVVGEEAEEKADEIAFEVVAVVAGFLQRVMELAHELGGFDVDGVLILELTLLDADHEAEGFDIVLQVGEGEADLGVFVQIVKLEALEVAQEQVARQLLVLEAREVFERLGLGFYEAAALALLLDEQIALPEQVDEAALVAKELHRLLIGRDAAAGDVENLKKFVVEGLGFALFVTGVFPFLREARGTGANLIPAQPHETPNLRRGMSMPLAGRGSRAVLGGLRLLPFAASPRPKIRESEF